MAAYSVLMSVYTKENPAFLKAAMDSVWGQTLPAKDFVLVCDGPLTPGLDREIARQQHAHPDALRVVRLPENRGLASALNEGLRHCKYSLVARMDSDDIAAPERCARQCAAFEADGSLDIVGCIVREFRRVPGDLSVIRAVPETADAIAAYSRRRNPFNHPGVMVRRDTVLACGGYPSLFLLEDYALWVRMLARGCRGRNLQETLLWMRVGDDTYRRRAGWPYVRAQWALFRQMRRAGYITRASCGLSLAARTLSSAMPNALRKACFRTMLRRRAPARPLQGAVGA